MEATFPTLLVAGRPTTKCLRACAQCDHIPSAPQSQGEQQRVFDISNTNFSITPGAGDIDYDLAIVYVQGLEPGACESVLNPSVTVFNVGQQMVSAFAGVMSFDGAAPLVVNWTGSLASGEGVDVAFCEGEPCVTLADGSHVANASVQLTGITDENASNDAYTTNFSHLVRNGCDVDHCHGQLPWRNHMGRDGLQRNGVGRWPLR